MRMRAVLTQRLEEVLQRLAPDLAAALAHVEDVRDLPHESRATIADILGHEYAQHGFGPDNEPNAYGDELEALIDALALEE